MQQELPRSLGSTVQQLAPVVYAPEPEVLYLLVAYLNLTPRAAAPPPGVHIAAVGPPPRFRRPAPSDPIRPFP